MEQTWTHLKHITNFSENHKSQWNAFPNHYFKGIVEDFKKANEKFPEQLISINNKLSPGRHSLSEPDVVQNICNLQVTSSAEDIQAKFTLNCDQNRKSPER